jgi:hypothetical protein
MKPLARIANHPRNATAIAGPKPSAAAEPPDVTIPLPSALARKNGGSARNRRKPTDRRLCSSTGMRSRSMG